jgi:hypothetical protein
MNKILRIFLVLIITSKQGAAQTNCTVPNPGSVAAQFANAVLNRQDISKAEWFPSAEAYDSLFLKIVTDDGSFMSTSFSHHGDPATHPLQSGWEALLYFAQSRNLKPGEAKYMNSFFTTSGSTDQPVNYRRYQVHTAFARAKDTIAFDTDWLYANNRWSLIGIQEVPVYMRNIDKNQYSFENDDMDAALPVPLPKTKYTSGVVHKAGHAECLADPVAYVRQVAEHLGGRKAGSQYSQPAIAKGF